MKQDIRLKTCLIIKHGSDYLVGWSTFYNRPNYSHSYYDAWRTRDKAIAERLAKKLNGVLYLFNPIVGQIKPFEEEVHENQAG